MFTIGDFTSKLLIAQQRKYFIDMLMKEFNPPYETSALKTNAIVETGHSQWLTN